MPRYDYRCTACGEEFELVQSFSEAGNGTCPVCSGTGRRVYHAVPVIYKGSGFYTTDYGRPKQPVENGSKDSSDSKESKESKEASTAKDSAKTSTATDGGSSSSQGSSGATDSKSESPAKTGSDSSS